VVRVGRRRYSSTTRISPAARSRSLNTSHSAHLVRLAHKLHLYPICLFRLFETSLTDPILSLRYSPAAAHIVGIGGLASWPGEPIAAC